MSAVNPATLSREDAIRLASEQVEPRFSEEIEKHASDPLRMEILLGIPAYWPGNREIEESDFASWQGRRWFRRRD